ncbi:unnamed protein product [Dracunculus medinensis]|uniref:Transcription initiation factor TFIID subunit 6 n=1 Tax=Dracunculus medinensis TaxID=318479 RepID=A0A0N4U6F4_DRAME|nr:unnamed protein product [Dracunculus medinensis]
MISPLFIVLYLKNLCLKFQTVAETVGIGNLSDNCALEIAVNLTYVIKDVMEQAKKFTSHGRRKRLIADDIDGALSIKGYQPLFGFCCKDGIPFRFAGSLGRDLFITDERDVDITHVVNAAAPKLPLETALKAHWLVIDGEQPAVPENPTPMALDEASGSVAENRTKDAGPIILTHVGKALRKNEQVQIKTMTTHALSVEQQIFFKEVTEAIMGSDDARRTEALHSLQTDAGLQPILPRLTLAIAEGIRCNIAQHNLALLIYLIRMIQSLTLNPALSLDRSLHQLLPAILSCILSRHLCARPDVDNHWALREFSSRLIASICKSYNNINNLRSRVTQVLTNVLFDDNASINTIYGSVFTLNELGMETIKAVVLPYIPKLFNDIRKSVCDKTSTTEKIAIERLESLIVKILVTYVRSQKPAHLKEITDYRSTFGGYGDEVYEMINADSSTSGGEKFSVSNSLNSSRSKSPVDRRLNASSSLASHRLIVGSTKQNQSPCFVVRTQSSLVTRNSQSTFVNTSTGGRLQPTSGVFNNNRSNASGGFYISGSGDSQANSYIVRPSGVKKVIMSTSQRNSSGSANDGYRNL